MGQLVRPDPRHRGPRRERPAYPAGIRACHRLHQVRVRRHGRAQPRSRRAGAVAAQARGSRAAGPLQRLLGTRRPGGAVEPLRRRRVLGRRGEVRRPGGREALRVLVRRRLGTRDPSRGIPAGLIPRHPPPGRPPMPAPPTSSSAWQARQALGARLGELRQDAGLTGRALAYLCGWHESKVSRIEHARTAPSADDIRAWCQHCGRPGETEDLITFLRTVEDMFVEWRRMERTGLRRAQEAVLPLWERTRLFRAYSSWLIPGAVVMAGQLGHLITVASLPSVSLGIIPMGLDRDAVWPVEDFWIFDDRQVNVELVSGWLTLTQPREIAMYAQTFGDLSQLAVRGAQARTLITAAIGELG